MTNFTLKIVALLFMILDHVHTYLGLGPQWISILPRFVAPLFVYLLVEGFFKTRSRKKYFQRTGVFALIMQAGNILINLFFKNTDPFTGKMTFFSIMNGNNILLTLSIFLLIMMTLENIKHNNKKILSIIGFLILSLFSLFVEGGVYLLPILLIMYFFYGNKRAIMLGTGIISLLFLAKALYNYMIGATGIGLYPTLTFNNEWAMIFVLLPIYLYNGERGRTDAFAKWFFYIIYPLHLWILMILSFIFVK